MRLPASSASRAVGLTGWLLRVPVVLIFLHAGGMKLPDLPGSPWVPIFAQIGVGQWFRLFTGVVEITGAVLLLIPRTSSIAAAALACTMIGAILTHILIIGVTSASLLPVVLLAVLAGILAKERKRRGR
jgi:putative oxidoreductase